MPGVPDLTDVARSSLLDALEALEEQKEALVLVGAQAIYLRVGEAYAAVAPFTTDGDLLIDPAFLADDPQIATLMEAGGFRLVEEDVGMWVSATTGVTIDLLVPKAVGGSGRRGARLGIHGKRVAKKVAGLEGALVDRDRMAVASAEPDDSREFDILVAGPAALLVSKLFKLAERRDEPRRLDNKDALDVFRLLQGTPANDLADRLRHIIDDPLGHESGVRGIELLSELFGAADAMGSSMAAQAVVTLDDPAFVAASCAALSAQVRALLPTRLTTASG